MSRSARGAVVVALLAVALIGAERAQVAAASRTRENAYKIQHSFGGGSDGVEDTKWEDCGVLKTRVTEKESSVVFNGIKVAYDSLSDKTKELMGLAANSGGYYRLRIATTSSDASARDQDFVVTSVKAACLGASNFRDHFNLHFDESASTLISADHTAVGVDCPAVEDGTGDHLSAVSVKSIGPTSTSVKFSKVAPALSVIERRRSKKRDAGDGSMDLTFDDDEDYEDEDGEEGDGKGEKKKDERTWLQKNWMLCLAGGMMVMNLLGSAMDPSRQQGQRRRAQAAGSGAPT